MSKDHDSKGGLLRSAGAMTIMTLLSRVTGLVREQVRGYFLGTGMGSDAFGVGAMIPNLLRRLFAEGAMTAAVVPVIADYKDDGDDHGPLWRFLGAFLTLFSALMAVVVVVGVVLSPWIVDVFFGPGFEDVPGKVALTAVLTMIMFPYLGIVSVAAMVQAVLNSFRVFAPSAFTPVLLNLTVIASAALLSGLFPDPSYAFAVGFVAGGVLQLAFQIPYLRRTGFKLRLSLDWRHAGVRKVFKLFIPGVFAAGIYQVNVLVSQVIASTLTEGTIASLQYSIRLQELVLGVFAVSIATVILPSMSAQAVKGKTKELGESFVFSMEVLLFIMVPAAVGLILLREPIVRLLFERGAFDASSTAMTTWAVLFHSIGIPAVGLSRIAAQPFFATKDTKTPAWIAVGTLVVNVVACLVLMGPLGNGGIALANSLSAAFTFAVMLLLLSRRLGGLPYGRLGRSIAKTSLATAVMAGVIIGVDLVVPSASLSGVGALLLYVGGVVAVALVAFFVVARVVGSSELRQLLGALRRR